MTAFDSPVAQRFSRASGSYNDVSFIQKKSAALLTQYIYSMSTLADPPQNILDVGAGTGYLSEQLHRIYPHAQYTLLDFSEGMLKQAELLHHAKSHFNYQLINFDAFSDYHSYDLVVSNLAFQWSTDLKRLLFKLKQCQSMVGFSIIVENTFHEWHAVLKKYNVEECILNYPCSAELKAYFNADLSQEVDYHEYSTQLRFSGLYEFLHYLRALGASTGADRLSYSTLKTILAHEQDPFEITYHILFVIKRSQ